MANVYPSLEDIPDLKFKPTEGELHLVNYLNKNLDESYEVFLNPFFDGDKPDIIILKKGVAAFLIEVKDDELEHYNVNSYNKWSVITNQSSNPISSPQSKVFTYKKNLYELHLPVLGLSNLSNRNYFNLVQPFVYFHKANKSQISQFYEKSENENREGSKLLFEQKKNNQINDEEYNRKAKRIDSRKKALSKDQSICYGSDGLQDLVNKIKSYNSHVLFDESIYDDFKQRLMPNKYELKQKRNKIALDANQKKLIVSAQYNEKIKGIAGSGKTTIAAHRAINAHDRHKSKVLILTYNITLKKLIKDKINDVLGYKDANDYAITNYHQFFNSQLNATNRNASIIMDQYGLNSIEEVYSCDCFEIYKYEVDRYKTILIDEVQDFKSEWIKIIKSNFLADDGEMVLFGDESQNIYVRDKEKEAMMLKGFGRWHKLKRSYRTSLDSSLNKVLKAFQQLYLIEKYDDIELFDTESSQVEMTYRLLKYHLLNQRQHWENEAFELIQTYMKEHNLPPNEIVILASNVYLARRLTDRFDGIEKIHCMFETYNELAEVLRIYAPRYLDKKFKLTPEIKLNELVKLIPENELTELIKNSLGLKQELEKVRRTKKNHFDVNSGMIKASTIHSFKGLESKTVFYLIDERDSSELVYTSITRAIENLVILDRSGTSKYSNFFSNMDDIETYVENHQRLTLPKIIEDAKRRQLIELP